MGSRRTLRRIAALALGATLGLAAAEGLVRGVWLARHGTASDRGGYSGQFLEHHERFGWLGTPGTRVRHRTTEFDVEIEVNEHGLRQQLEGTRGAARSLCLLGDSFAFGQGVEESERVGERLAARHEGLSVLSVALPAIGTDQQLLLYTELDGPHLESELVVLLYFLENVERNAARERHGLAKPWFELEGGRPVLRGVPVPDRFDRTEFDRPDLPWSARAKAWMRRHSALYVLLRRSLRPSLRGSAEDPEDLYPTYAEDGPAWQLTRALLTELRDIVSERDARLVVAIVPERWHLLDGRPHVHQETVLKACGELGIPALDLTPAFVRSGDSRGRDAYYATDGHWRPRGHEVAARALSRFLLEHELLD